MAAEDERSAAVAAAETKVATEAAQALVEERQQRLGDLDKVRQEVNVLGEALRQR